MIGTVEILTWRTVAADVDGVPQPAEVGKLTVQQSARFAFRAEGELWAAGMAMAGFEVDWFASAAVSYFGPTDAPGNCWSVTVSKAAAE